MKNTKTKGWGVMFALLLCGIFASCSAPPPADPTTGISKKEHANYSTAYLVGIEAANPVNVLTIQPVTVESISKETATAYITRIKIASMGAIVSHAIDRRENDYKSYLNTYTYPVTITTILHIDPGLPVTTS